MLERGGFNPPLPFCDLCHKNRGLEYHELIARNITQGNPEARELSFQKELCCLLCKTCHEQADETEIQIILWQHNRSRYEKGFQDALDKLQAVMKTEITIYG